MKTYYILLPIFIIVAFFTLIFNPVSTDHHQNQNNTRIISSAPDNQAEDIVTAVADEKETRLPMEKQLNSPPAEESSPVTVAVGRERENPGDKLFTVDLKAQPTKTSKVWLEYDLYGLEDYTSVPRSINDNLATGGVWQRKNNQWTHQKEEIKPDVLKQGPNKIRFTTYSGNADYLYQVKNLTISVENENTYTRRLVVNQPTTAYYYKRFGYLQGFVEGNGSEQAIVRVAGKQAPLIEGVFEQLVDKPENAPECWSTLVEATFPDGQKISTEVTFNHPVDCDSFYGVNKTRRYVETLPTPEGDFRLHLDGMCLDAGKGALTPESAISITGLRDIDFPMMDPYMINVTENAGAYRCLPHGTTFSGNVVLSLEYDPSRIPQGYTPEDIYTLYYDEGKSQWVPLERDTIDLANNTIVSHTTHFTDFINGIIKVPESPLTQAYTPTSIKDIKAANPLEAMEVIAPPTANNMGTANLSYPLILPPGRHGMQPQLTLQYNSGGGNGWLGLGWDISIPAITVETRWGVPHYSPTKESETYLVNGEQVATKDANGFYNKMSHRADWVNRIADTVLYYPRVEGAFDKIMRHGTGPSTYWWEVIDRSGNHLYYGKSHSSNIVDPMAVLADTSGNIAQWSLTETRDPFNNVIRYYYDIVWNAGVTNSYLKGKQIYLSKINYTGCDTTDGNFSVLFKRYPKGSGTRPDVIINARNGFKEVTADLLKQVAIVYNSTDTIRRYFMTYTTGEFGKTLLCAFYEAEANDSIAFTKNLTPFNSCRYLTIGNDQTIKVHNFDYYNDFTTDDPGNSHFTSPVQIATGLDGSKYMEEYSAIGGTKSASFGYGGNLTAGLGYDVMYKTISVGGDYKHNISKSKGINTLIDINGDGLPEKVWSNSSGMHFKRHYKDSNGNYQFGGDSTISGIPSQFLYQETKSNSWGAEAMFGVSLSYQNTKSTSTTSKYFADVNGDGLMDFVDDNEVYFNKLKSNGTPEFFKLSTGNDTVRTGESDCEYTLYRGSVDDTVAYYNHLDPRIEQDFSRPFDAVRVWVAPYGGNININAPIRLVEDTSLARRMAKHADGIRFTIQHNAVELHHDTISPGNYSLKTHPTLNATVVKGDKIFFRLQSVINRTFDRVVWNPVISYNGQLEQYDPNNKEIYIFNASQDFLLDENSIIGTPTGGTVKIEGRIIMPVLSDSVTVKITRNRNSTDSTVFQRKFRGTSAVDTSLNLTLTNVHENDLFTFRMLANSEVDWSAISFKPHMYFTSNTDNLPDTNTNGSPTFDFHPAINHSLYPKPIFTTLPYTFSGTSIRVTPVMTFSPALGTNGTVVFTVKSTNQLKTKRFLTIQNGQISSPPTLTISFTTGQKLYFEYYSTDTVLMSKLTAATVTVVGIGTRNAGARTLYSSTLLKFGALYRGWGQFTYNSPIDSMGQPIRLNYLVYDPNLADTTSINSLPDTTNFLENAQSICDSLTNTLDSRFNPLNNHMIMMPADPQKNAYVGFGQITHICRDTIMHYWNLPDQITLDDPIPLPSEPNRPVRTVRKQSFSNDNSFDLSESFTKNGYGTSFTSGENELLMDYFDINGDHYPDIVGAETAQVTDPQGGLSDQSVGHYSTQFRSDMNKNISLGTNFGTSYSHTAEIENEDPKKAETVFVCGGGTSVSGSANNDNSNYTWQDINGDGLPDKIKEDGTVFLNHGYDFCPLETWDFPDVKSGLSLDVGAGTGSNFSIWNLSFSGGLAVNMSESFNYDIFQDINGDGLSDKVVYNILTGSKVYFNTGNGFSQTPVSFNFPTTSKAYTQSGSVNAGGSYGIPINIFGIPFKFTIGLNGTYGNSINTNKYGLIDMNADGYPDFVEADNNGYLYVSYSTIGRTNLLKEVDNYLGGSMLMDYSLSENSSAMSQRQWTMSSLRITDGIPGDGPNVTSFTFKYDSGYYSRYERQFFGFKTVKTFEHDSSLASPVYRSVIERFHNDNFVFKGLKYEEIICKDSSQKYISTLWHYILKEIATGDSIPLSQLSCYGEGFPAISREEKYYYEGLFTDPQIITRKRYEHGAFGNIIKYYDDGDLAIERDDIYADIYYHPDLQNKHIISADSLIEVSHHDTLYRKREAKIDFNTGAVKKVIVYNNAALYVSDMSYNADGNLNRIAFPANGSGQRMVYYYKYDADVTTYVIKVSDTLGDSTLFTWNPRFGKQLTSTDIAGQQMAYQYDHRGRLTQARGPYEIAANKPYTIKFTYWDQFGVRSDPGRADTIPWARTSHYDPAHPTNNIQTVLFADSRGKVLQTKKDIALYDATAHADIEKASVSGRILYDAHGRTVKSWLPVVENLGSDSIFNANYDNIMPSSTTYDVLDRNTSFIRPDTATTYMNYAFGHDKENFLRFRTVTIDAKGIPDTAYSDPQGRQTAVKNPVSRWTSFIYNPVGELISSTDPEGYITHYSYDMAGRRTQRVHPDAGTTIYKYDPAGNLVGIRTQNLINQGGDSIKYQYSFNRLTTVHYPNNPENDVHLQYGAPGSGTSTGRLVKQEDVNGVKELTYGRLGEVVQETKTMIVPKDSIYTFATKTVYDTWNRIDTIVYPDGEVVKYNYNIGGQLKHMAGVKNGVSRTYVDSVRYDKFESRTRIKYGNSTYISYSYNPKIRNLNEVKAVSSNNYVMMDNIYTFDKVNNITKMLSATSPNTNNIGGKEVYYCTYDSLYRLTAFQDTGVVTGPNTYSGGLAMTYSRSGKILSKNQLARLNGTNISSLTYNSTYSYQGTQPHAASSVGSENLTYDANGNMIHRLLGSNNKCLVWDEDNRLKLVADNAKMGEYLYDAAGERTLKISGNYATMTINGKIVWQGYQSDKQTLYVNPFMVVNNKEYTKHYYIEGERIATRLGGGFANAKVSLFSQIYGFNIQTAANYTSKRVSDEAMVSRDVTNCGASNQWQITSGLLAFLRLQPGRNDAENDAYFYHGDHLGSSTYVTDRYGMPSQHIQYLAFGEILLEQKAAGKWYTPYKFNSKELDDETGLDYYGARYYDPKLSMFFGVDRYTSNYPSLSPYSYSKNNPITFLEINGDSAWKVTRNWNISDVLSFANYAQKRLVEYEGKNVDCADLSIDVLIDYASKNGLPLELFSSDGTSFNSNSDNYHSVGDYKYGYSVPDKKDKVGGVLTLGAKDIASNTFLVDKKDAHSGDMIILTAPADHVANYSKMTPKRKLTYGNIGEPVKTSPDWSNFTREEPRPGRPGRAIKYNPDRNHVHRWNFLNF